MIRKCLAFAAAAATLTACSYVDEYEKAVYDMEPVYCYRTIGGPECHPQPSFAARAKLVNYYGPHPSRYDAPEPVAVPDPKSPEMVNYWVKDPEPVPRAAPQGDVASLPWLTDEGRADQAARADWAALEKSGVGTRAFLRRIADGAAAPQPLERPEGAPQIQQTQTADDGEAAPAAAPVTPVATVSTF